MKKILVLLVAVLMVFGLVGAAFAESGSAGEPQPAAENAAKVHHPKVKDLQGFDQLIQLRAEGKATRDQIKANHDQLKSLVQAARQSKNKQALEALKPFKSTLKQQHADMKALGTTQKGNWEAMKEARQANNEAQMQTILNQIISTRQTINSKLLEIKTTLDQMIQALQTAPTAAPQQ